MNDLWRKVKNWWINNDMDEASEVISVVITVSTIIVGLIWGFISLVLGAIDFLMLGWIIKIVVIVSIANTIRIVWRDRKEWNGDDEDDDDEHSLL